MKWLIFLVLTPDVSPSIEWGFIAAQEQFVVESVEPTKLHGSIDKHHRYLLSVMAETDYKRRDWASEEMKKLGISGVHACFVGQTLNDPEVRLRCRNVLRTISKCSMCDGQGAKMESWGEITCKSCNGVGHFLPIDEF